MAHCVVRVCCALCLFLPSAAAVRFRSNVAKPKLDVGFSNFSKNISMSVASAVDKAAVQWDWPSNIRSNFSTEVVAMVAQRLGDELKPLKQEIGKTWVLFKTEEDRDRYAEELRHSFFPAFGRSEEQLTSHVDLAVRHAARIAKEGGKQPDSKLLAQGVKSVEEALFNQRCFKNPKFNRTDPRHNQTETCIRSPSAGMMNNLRDAEQLVSMGLKMEKGVMMFVQKKETNTRKAR